MNDGTGPLERGLMTGLAAYRWAAWAWMALMLLLQRDSLARPGIAMGLIVAALGVTFIATGLLREPTMPLYDRRLIVGEAVVGGSLLLADGWVYDAAHTLSREQNLGVAWPLAGVLAVAAAHGPVRGIVVGVLLGLMRTVSTVANHPDPLVAADIQNLITTIFNFGLAGWAGGLLARLLREAETRISAARAREEVARTLHDGVLQTLAIVERRAGDPSLAKLAREQERDLRAFLFDAEDAPLIGAGSLGASLRAVAGTFEDRFGARATVLVPDDLPAMRDEVITALAGAVGEALTNAGKHGDCSRATVFVEPQDGQVFCSVKDDGAGFDPATVEPGQGITDSIIERIIEVGGDVEITSRPGGGTEVELRVPAG